jgi:hypothetical protein
VWACVKLLEPIACPQGASVLARKKAAEGLPGSRGAGGRGRGRAEFGRMNIGG